MFGYFIGESHRYGSSDDLFFCALAWALTIVLRIYSIYKYGMYREGLFAAFLSWILPAAGCVVLFITDQSIKYKVIEIIAIALYAYLRFKISRIEKKQHKEWLESLSPEERAEYERKNSEADWEAKKRREERDARKLNEEGNMAKMRNEYSKSKINEERRVPGYGKEDLLGGKKLSREEEIQAEVRAGRAKWVNKGVKLRKVDRGAMLGKRVETYNEINECHLCYIAELESGKVHIYEKGTLREIKSEDIPWYTV